MHPAVFSRFCRNSEKYVRVIKCCKESCQTNNKLAIRDFWQIFRAFTALFKCKCVSPHFLSFISSAAQKMSILYRVSISRYIVCWSRGNNSRSCYREILSIFIGKGMIEKKKKKISYYARRLYNVFFWLFPIGPNAFHRQMLHVTWWKGQHRHFLWYWEKYFIGVSFPNIKSYVLAINQWHKDKSHRNS